MTYISSNRLGMPTTIRASAATIFRVAAVLAVLLLGAITQVAADRYFDPELRLDTTWLVSP